MEKNTTPKKKIMHITHALGGVQTYLEYILFYTDKNKFESVVVAPADKNFHGFCNGLAKYHPLKIGRNVNPFADMAVLVKIIRLIRKEKPDLLHVHSAKAGFLGRLAGKF